MLSSKFEKFCNFYIEFIDLVKNNVLFDHNHWVVHKRRGDELDTHRILYLTLGQNCKLFAGREWIAQIFYAFN